MGKLKQSKLFNQLNNMSIRMSFVLYALFSLLIGIIICIFLISIIDNYRINLNTTLQLLKKSNAQGTFRSIISLQINPYERE